MKIIVRNSKSVQPRNSSVVNTARSVLDATVARAVKQYDNALQVDGFPIIYYRRLTNGVTCSCVGDTQSVQQGLPENLEPGVTVLDPAGFGSDEFVQTMVQGSVFSINRYGARPNDADNLQRVHPAPPQRRSFETRPQSADMDDPVAQQIEPFDTDDLFSLGELAINAATNTTTCGVCLGTGYVGGYAPSNAHREVLDIKAPWSGIEIRHLEERPSSFSGQALSVRRVFPAGAKAIQALRAWNNKTQLNLDITIDGVPSTEFAQFDGREHLIEISLGGEVMTHLEIQLELDAPPLLAGWSRITFSENLALPENMEPPSLVLSPTLPAVALYDIITEPVFRKVWKITTHSPTYDRERQLHGWRVTARLLQDYELPSNLPRLINRVWKRPVTVAQMPAARATPVVPFLANNAPRQNRSR